MDIHPHAASLARVAGMTREHATAMIEDVAKRTDLLVGGYYSDTIVLSVWIALLAEDDEPLADDDIIERILQVLFVTYEGIAC